MAASKCVCSRGIYQGSRICVVLSCMLYRGVSPSSNRSYPLTLSHQNKHLGNLHTGTESQEPKLHSGILSEPSWVISPKLHQRILTTTFFLWPKILKSVCISHLPLNKLLGLLQITPLNLSGSTSFLHSVLPKCCCQKTLSLFLILILPLATFNIKFRLLSFTPKLDFSIFCIAVHPGPHSPWSWALQSAAGSPWHYLQAEFLLHLRLFERCFSIARSCNVWILNIRKAIIKRWVPTLSLNLTRVKLLMTQ